MPKVTVMSPPGACVPLVMYLTQLMSQTGCAGSTSFMAHRRSTSSGSRVYLPSASFTATSERQFSNQVFPLVRSTDFL